MSTSLNLFPLSYLFWNVRQMKRLFYITTSTDCEVKSCQANHLFPQPAAAFRNAYESLKLDSSGTKSVSMLKIWHLIMVCLQVVITITLLFSKLLFAVPRLTELQTVLY